MVACMVLYCCFLFCSFKKMNDSNKVVFKEYNRCASDKSSVWQYFLRAEDGQQAQCKTCKKKLKTSGTTTSLRNHLKGVHSIQLDSRIAAPVTPSDALPSVFQGEASSSQTQSKRPKKMDDFFRPANEETLDTMIAKMAAVDGLPFRVFCCSESMKTLFKKAGYKNLPKSPHTIKSTVMSKSSELKKVVEKDLQKLKADGFKLAVSIDEWTSARNRRYMNVNVHSPEIDKGFYNLGLSRILGCGSASNCTKILKEKLSSYGLLLEKDIACVVSDGASVMCALGRMIPSYHQLCLARGI